MSDDSHHYTPDEVVKLHLGLAHMLAGRYQDHSHPYEDVLQECLAALWDAAKRNPGESLRGGLASRVMAARAINYRFNEKPPLGAPHVSRNARSEEAMHEASYYQGWQEYDDWGGVDDLIIMEDANPTPEEATLDILQERELWAEFQKVVAELDGEYVAPRDKDCLRLISEGKGKTNADIARELGVSRQAISARAGRVRKELRQRVSELVAA